MLGSDEIDIGWHELDVKYRGEDKCYAGETFSPKFGDRINSTTLYQMIDDNVYYTDIKVHNKTNGTTVMLDVYVSSEVLLPWTITLQFCSDSSNHRLTSEVRIEVIYTIIRRANT